MQLQKVIINQPVIVIDNAFYCITDTQVKEAIDMGLKVECVPVEKVIQLIYKPS